MTDTSTALSNFDSALHTAETMLPTILSVVSIFFPAAKALIPFLALLPEVINAVEIVMKATGGDFSTAMAEVSSHLTPGQPNSAALSNNANQGS